MKWLTLLLYFVFSLHANAQEICENGRDDDADGKIDLQDEDCKCNGNFVKIREQSIILNPSFEEHTNCPTAFSQMAFVKEWVQPSEGTSDYINTCGTFDPTKENPDISKMPLPIPDGNGVVGIINGFLDDIFYKGSYKEYVGTILTQPLKQNQTYILEVQVGFGPDLTKSPPIELSIFGNPSRAAFPIDYRAECPLKYFPDWLMVGSTVVSGQNKWVTASIEFTAPVDIHSIAIGPPCADASDTLLYYYLDNLVLYRKEDKGKVWLNVTQSPPCDNTVTLSSNTLDESFNYQWFKNGIAIPQSTESSIIFRNNERDNGRYQLMISNGNDCQLSEPFDYTHFQKTPIFADLGPDIFACSEKTVTLEARQDEVGRFSRSYKWSDGSNMETLKVTRSGIYWLEYTTQAVDGTRTILCVTRDSIIVNFDLNYQLDFGPEKYICENNPVQIGNEFLNGTHKWSTGETTSTINVSTPGTYKDTVDYNGCTLIGTVSVVPNPLKVDLGDNIEACDGKAVHFQPSLPAGTKYLWNRAYTEPSYTAYKTQNVILQAEFEGCRKHDTVFVQFNPSPQFDLGADTSLCAGLPLTLDAFVPNAIYQWNTGSTNAKIYPKQSGDYSVHVTGNNGCFTDDTIKVHFNTLPSLDLGKDLSLCRGSEVQVTPSAAFAESYIWNDGVRSASRNISVTGTYYLQAQNQCGTVTDTMQVYDGGICKLIFANAFTPNGDGKNDVFPGNRIPGIENYSLQIFNRWGQQVFSSKNISKGWDGTINFQPAPAGNYAWKASFKDGNTGIIKNETGNVLLIR